MILLMKIIKAAYRGLCSRILISRFFVLSLFSLGSYTIIDIYQISIKRRHCYANRFQNVEQIAGYE